jgi:hypothetical protein
VANEVGNRNSRQTETPGDDGGESGVHADMIQACARIEEHDRFFSRLGGLIFCNPARDLPETPPVLEFFE